MLLLKPGYFYPLKKIKLFMDYIVIILTLHE